MAKSLVENPIRFASPPTTASSPYWSNSRSRADNMGKVIGKEGRIANAMRSLVKVAAAREGERAVLDII